MTAGSLQFPSHLKDIAAADPTVLCHRFFIHLDPPGGACGVSAVRSKHSRMYSCTQCHTTELEPVGRAAPRQTRKQKEEAKVAASASTFASSATVSTSQMEADNDSEDQDVDHEMEDSKDQEDLENAASAEHGKRRGNPPGM